MKDEAPISPTPPPKAERSLGFGAQVLIGLVVGVGFGLCSVALKLGDLIVVLAKVLGVAAIVLCLVPRVRGIGVGLLLGLGLAAIIFVGICFANFKI